MNSVADPGDKFMFDVVDTGHKCLDRNINENIHKNAKWLYPYNEGPGYGGN
jgi:hypothetical protein